MLIIIDALRYESFMKVLKLGLLKNLSLFASKGVFFEKAYSLTNTTEPSLTTILSGLHPLEHGVLHHGRKVTRYEYSKARHVLTLPMILAKKGWCTIAVDFLEKWFLRGFTIYVSRHDPLVSSSSGRIILTINAMINRGYDGVENIVKSITSKRNPISLCNMFRDPHITTDLALKYLKNTLLRRKKFFMFIHYWATHTPYYSLRRFLKQLKPVKNLLIPPSVEDHPLEYVLKSIGNPHWRRYLASWFKGAKLLNVSNVILSYYASFLAVDKELGRLIKFLNEHGLMDEVMVIVTADHGESLGEHGIYFDHHGLYEVSIRVPLILYSENLGKKRAKGTALHTDIAPTVLHAAQIDKGKCVNSYHLFRLLDSDPRIGLPLVFFETFTQTKIGIIHNNYKYTKALSMRDSICRYCFSIHGGVRELYDLKRDPEEKNNIAYFNKDIIAYFERKFARIFLKFKAKITALRHKQSKTR